jgi:hypothetical protein
MVVVLIRSNHIGGVEVSVHAASDMVTSNQYNYHQHPIFTTLAACTLIFTPMMWLLLINTTTINTHSNQIGGVKVSVHATSAVDSGC